MELFQMFSYVVKNNHDNSGLQAMYSCNKYWHNCVPSTTHIATVGNKCHPQSKENVPQGLNSVDKKLHKK
eukprot:15251698-Ditylum_brightwellii.AAC.1